jgi:replicative DNA helicase
MINDKRRGWRDDVQQVDHALGKLRARVARLSPQSIRRGLLLVVSELERRYERPPTKGISTGLSSVDRLLGGLRPGEVSVLAARPWMGTTSLALGWALAAADRSTPTLLFSPELSTAALVERLLRARSRVDAVRIRTGMLETAHWVRITRSASELSELPIQIDDHPSPSLDGICDAVHRWRADEALFSAADMLGLVVIDAARYVRSSLAARCNGYELGRRIKELATSTRTHMVVVGSISSAVDHRADHRPVLQDLRPRGLDRAADAVAFLYRDEVYSKDRCAEEDRWIAELIVPKNSSGPSGTVRLRFLNHLSRFEVVPEDADAQP